MVALLKVIATLSAAFFAGGGLFVSMVLYPAIMTDMASAVAQFGTFTGARHRGRVRMRSFACSRQ
jgi:uncharacterized membrane protein